MRKYLIGIGLAAIVALTAGCGGNDDAAKNDAGNGGSEPTAAEADSGAEHNDQDMAFAQAMIPHHQQAVEMADLAAKHATDPKVKDLATRIKGAQDPEIEKMNGMLDQWGGAMEDMPGMDHGDMGGMPGMMTDDEMAKLEKASGAAFDTMWVQMMIKHHQGAVKMAKDEIAKGSNADAKALAEQIVDAQKAEIKEMQAMK